METGLYVMRHGEPTLMQDEPVHRLWERGVRVMGDLVGHTQSAATWCIPTSMPWLKPKLLLTPPPVSSMIQRGLCWRCSVKISPLSPLEFAEIFGWVRNGPILLVNVQRSTKQDKTFFLPRLPLYGAGTDVWLDADLILKS